MNVWEETVLTNATAECIALLLRTQEVPDSNLGLETGYPDRCFSGFPQSL
jgi:hypothetical protein